MIREMDLRLKGLKKGDVVYIDIPKDIYDTHKQAGCRPCIIMSNNVNNKYNSRVQYIPLTSRDKKYIPTHVRLTSTDCLPKDSIALCECLDSISKNFIKDKIGHISNEDMLNIELGKDIQLADDTKFTMLINMKNNERLAFA